MKLINQTFEICNSHDCLLSGIYKDIERAARVSYKSEDKITEGSAKVMVERLISMKHYSPLEFGTVYLCTDNSEIVQKYISNPHSRVIGNRYITTNYRVIVENHWEKDLEYLCAPSTFHIRRTTIKFTCPRIISQMFMRHRVFSFLQESQRYVNYTRDKFGNEVHYIIPVQCKDEIPNNTELQDNIDVHHFVWGDRDLDEVNHPMVSRAVQILLYSFYHAEFDYKALIQVGYKPQQARAVLPNYTATTFYMCGFDDDWDEFFDKRDIHQVDPQIFDIVHPLHEQLKQRRIAEGVIIKSDISKQL